MRTATSPQPILTPPAASLPSLSPIDRVAHAVAALPAAAVWLPARGGAGSLSQLLRALSFAVARWLLVIAVLNLGRRLQKQSARLISERAAAVDGSRFAEVAPGVVLHYTLLPPPSTEAHGGGGYRPLLVHFAHGFGANALTWDPMFESLGSKLADVAPRTGLWLAASDRLGFGLSPRPRDAALYGQEPGATFALALVDSLLPLCDGSSDEGVRATPSTQSALGSSGGGSGSGSSSGDGDESGGESGDESGGGGKPSSAFSPKSVIESQQPPDSLAISEAQVSAAAAARGGGPEAQTLLVGHSLGGALSARMAVQATRRTAAGDAMQGDRRLGGLVLVAPALISPSGASPSSPVPTSSSPAATSTSASSSSPSKVAYALLTPLRLSALATLWLLRSASAAISAVASVTFISCLQLCVNCMVHSRGFWLNGVGAAYADPKRLSEQMLTRYRWPAQVRGSSLGVARFVLAQTSAVQGELSARLVSHLPGRRLMQRLVTSRSSMEEPPLTPLPPARAPSDAEVIDALGVSGLPVLIVHGADDRLVPLSNSRALVERLRSCGCDVQLVVLPDCGHCPQEEYPQLVSDAIAKFASANGLLDAVAKAA